jgi:hypothetical protein
LGEVRRLHLPPKVINGVDDIFFSNAFAPAALKLHFCPDEAVFHGRYNRGDRWVDTVMRHYRIHEFTSSFLVVGFKLS